MNVAAAPRPVADHEPLAEASGNGRFAGPSKFSAKLVPSTPNSSGYSGSPVCRRTMPTISPTAAGAPSCRSIS
jgi:hypothetical protein